MRHPTNTPPTTGRQAGTRQGAREFSLTASLGCLPGLTCTRESRDPREAAPSPARNTPYSQYPGHSPASLPARNRLKHWGASPTHPQCSSRFGKAHPSTGPRHRRIRGFTDSGLPPHARPTATGPQRS
jgi:hypothetical protein